MKIYFRSALVALLILTGAGGSVAPVFAADLAMSLEQSNRKAEPLKSASGEYKEASSRISVIALCVSIGWADHKFSGAGTLHPYIHKPAS